MFEFQTDLIFPIHQVAAAGPLPPRAERMSVRTGDGETLQGIHIPSEVLDSSRTLILGFGGNGWNGQDVAEYLHQLYPSHDVVAFHYRGYKPSTGSPSGDALIADVPLVYDTAIGRLKPARVIGVGFSIGTGVVAQLSIKRKLDGVILVTPFDSLKAVVASMYPWAPIGPFFRHQIDAAGPLQQSQVPAAIIAAADDEIVARERTDALRNVVKKLVYDETICGAGHNDIYARSDFQDAMRKALDRLNPQQGSSCH